MQAFDGKLEECGVYMAAVRGQPLNGNRTLTAGKEEEVRYFFFFFFKLSIKIRRQSK